MSIHAPPIKSGNFQCDRELEVVIGENSYDRKVFKRASPEHIYSLLTWVDPGPVMTKAGKPRKYQPPPHKDETAAFYQAQLIHYGLKPYKTKPAAKKALLAAFGNSKTLKVPDHILKLEEELKAQFKIKNEEAKEKYYQEKENAQIAKQKATAERRAKSEAFIEEVQKKIDKKDSSKSIVGKDQFGGTYILVAPKIADGWSSNEDFSMKLAPTASGRHLWGRFNFSVFVGVLRASAAQSNSIYETPSNTIQFCWRGRETGEGESSIGEKNKGTITFLGDDMIKGKCYWDCYGTFEFYGKKKEPCSMNLHSKSILCWKDEYRSLNQSNYDAECSSRWGGYSYNSDSEGKPELSDTDYEGDSDEDLQVTGKSTEPNILFNEKSKKRKRGGAEMDSDEPPQKRVHPYIQ